MVIHCVSAIALFGHLRVPYMYKHCSYMTGPGTAAYMESHVLQPLEDRRFGDPGQSLTVATCQRTLVSSSAARVRAVFRISSMKDLLQHRKLQVECLHLHDCTCHCYSTRVHASLPCLCKALTHLSRFGATQPINRSITQTTGCQSSTLKSTRITMQSHDRVVVLSSSRPPHHSGLHIDCDGLRSVSLNTLAEVQPDG